MKKYYIIGGIVLAVAIAGYFLFWKKDLYSFIVFPYIAHQKPYVDPHLPHSTHLSDKLDEVVFDGLFNVSANPSGITYDDGLGEFIGIDENDIVTIRLRTDKKWHDSYLINSEDDEVNLVEDGTKIFSARDLKYTLDRIKNLGSRSPDYILLIQALVDFNFEGPDGNNEIRFRFRKDREWSESDIKEMLSFKVLRYNSKPSPGGYTIGSGPYLRVDREAPVSGYFHNPEGAAVIPHIRLEPFIDNSTFTTELSNNNINVLPATPFGSLSPILADSEDFFIKSNISTTFFCLLFNTERLSREQRHEVRKLINHKAIVDRFYITGSEQQRHISDYKGNKNNYYDYLNNSIFPSSTVYVDGEIVVPTIENTPPDLSVIPDTVRVKACMNFGFREEYSELIDILNDPSLFGGKIKATAVSNEEIKNGNYDAVLLAVSGYTSKYLYDLYQVLLRQPDLETYRINLKTSQVGDTRTILPASLERSNNFFRMSATEQNEELADIRQLLQYSFEFMSSSEISDKEVFAQMIDQLEFDMALGKWLFSLPSLAYFTTQFDSRTIDLYGTASQFSTIERWREAER